MHWIHCVVKFREVNGPKSLNKTCTSRLIFTKKVSGYKYKIIAKNTNLGCTVA